MVGVYSFRHADDRGNLETTSTNQRVGLPHKAHEKDFALSGDVTAPLCKALRCSVGEDWACQSPAMVRGPLHDRTERALLVPLARRKLGRGVQSNSPIP